MTPGGITVIRNDAAVQPLQIGSNWQITDLKELSENALSKKELIEFQLNEINSIDPKVDEDIELSKQFKRLNNVDELISTLKNLNQSLTENEHSIYRQISSAIFDLDKISNYDDSIKSYSLTKRYETSGFF